MEQTEILARLGLALAIGFLIGVERGWREREEGEGERAAGLRTFALIGMFGGVFAALSSALGPIPFAAAFLALAGAATLFRWRETTREGGYGMTTLVAAFLTFGLGAYAVVGDMVVASAAAVATTALLAAKEWLHGWLKVLTWPELRAALILLAMSFVALPVLPDQGFGPYQALNPYGLWLMTIAIAGVSFIGYVAVRVAGLRHGILIAGIAGGLVSSTATTLDLARKARTAPAGWRLNLAGALAASATMFARVIVIVGLFGTRLLDGLLLPLAVATGVSVIGAVSLNPPWSRKPLPAPDPGADLRNPFDLREVLGFALLLAVVLVLSRALTEMFGGEGSIVLAAVAGIADVDAITLSMTEIAGDRVTLAGAEIAIFTAAGVNSLAKSAMAISVGGRRFGLAYLGFSLAAIAAAAAAALLQAWPW